MEECATTPETCFALLYGEIVDHMMHNNWSSKDFGSRKVMVANRQVVTTMEIMKAMQKQGREISSEVQVEAKCPADTLKLVSYITGIEPKSQPAILSEDCCWKIARSALIQLTYWVKSAWGRLMLDDRITSADIKPAFISCGTWTSWQLFIKDAQTCSLYGYTLTFDAKTGQLSLTKPPRGAVQVMAAYTIATAAMTSGYAVAEGGTILVIEGIKWVAVCNTTGVCHLSAALP
jgi:hypothetical protein